MTSVRDVVRTTVCDLACPELKGVWSLTVVLA